MAEKNLSKERNYIKNHKDELVKKYRNKYILVHGKEVIGSFEDYAEAFDEGVSRYGTDGIFLIKQIFDEDPINFIVEAML